MARIQFIQCIHELYYKIYTMKITSSPVSLIRANSAVFLFHDHLSIRPWGMKAATFSRTTVWRSIRWWANRRRSLQSHCPDLNWPAARSRQWTAGRWIASSFVVVGCLCGTSFSSPTRRSAALRTDSSASATSTAADAADSTVPTHRVVLYSAI